MNSVERGLHDLFKAQAMETPDEPAIVFGHERMSYGQLDQATDVLWSLSSELRCFNR